MFDKEEENEEDDYEDFEQPDDGHGNKYYAILKGRSTGIVNSWPECYNSINEYKGALYQKFNTIEKAENFMLARTRNETSEEIEEFDSVGQNQQDRTSYSSTARFKAASPTTSRTSRGTTSSMRRRRIFQEINTRPTLTDSQQDPPQEIYEDNTTEQQKEELKDNCPKEQLNNLILLLNSGIPLEEIKGIIDGWRKKASSTKTNVQR